MKSDIRVGRTRCNKEDLRSRVTMVFGETKTQGEKKDEASSMPKEAHEATEATQISVKEGRKKEMQMKKCKKDGTETRSSKDGTSSNMPDKGGTSLSSTPKTKTTIVELRRQLQLLQLPTSGNKAELVHRLKMYEDTRSYENTSENDEDNSDSETDEVTMVRVNDEMKSECDGSDEEIVVGDDVPRATRRNTSNRTRYGCRANLVTIKDVEGSISHFSRDDKMQVEKWIEEFEEVSELLEWNELQKVIYAKKLLRESAKQYMALQKGIKTWDVMKRRMRREFEK